MEKFDYIGAISELEAIVAKVEDPATGVNEIDSYVKRSEELIASCRKYLRTLRDKAGDLS